MKTYLITGGAGFIGSHLCDLLLEQGHRVPDISRIHELLGWRSQHTLDDVLRWIVEDRA